MVQLLAGLALNPLGEVEIEGVELSVRAVSDVTAYRVESLVYDRGPVRPGETVELGCVLRPYHGERVTRRLSLTVPEGITPGTELRVAVGPPERIEVALGRPLQNRLATATELEPFVRALGESRPENRLTAVLYERSRGIIARGEHYPELPPTALHLMESLAVTSSRRKTHAALLASAEVDLDGPVVGGLMIRLRLETELTTEEAD
jgi:hypothetical protein